MVQYGIMEKETQISALISRETRDLLERYVRETGIKKGHLIEEALRQYLQALEVLPRDVIVHSRVVLSKASGKRALAEIKRGKANRALRALMRDED